MANSSQYPGIQPLPRPAVSPMGHPPHPYPSVPMQFHQAAPQRMPPQYTPMVSPQFLSTGRPQTMQHLPPRPGPPPPHMHSLVTPPPPPPPAAQTFSVPDGPSGRPILSVSPHVQSAVPIPNNLVPGQNGPMAPVSLTYNLSTSATAQVHVNAETTSEYQPTSSAAPSVTVTTDLPKAVETALSDWIEHSHKGKRYYHNKKTKLSSWEKPFDLMSPIERADASTNWKECKCPDGRKYYYNKVTKQSKWRIPDELKLAREHVKIDGTTGKHESTKNPDNEASVSLVTDSPSFRDLESALSPVPVAPFVASVQSGSLLTAELSMGSIKSSKVATILTDETAVAAPTLSNIMDVSENDAVIAENGPPVNNIEESKGGTVTNDNANVAALEEKAVDQETLVYENKQEAKNAFKNLLENANVASDWTWDQAMRAIINDSRYVALRTLAERKQAFIEFIGQKKKQEAEEKRVRQRKAREEFKKMLEESKEITSSTKWSKAATIFEDDERFKAVERSKDLFDDYIMELEKKERSKALEEHKRNKKDYIEFLKSCDFLTASSQWRRVQDRLEADESCLRLEKIDRLEIFQEYIRDLEKDEEEQRKLRMEEIRKAERKNRDEFRKLMDGHITSGMLTSKTHWRDYCIKVKDLPAYLAVCSNSSGATPKDLFEDVIEELEKQFVDDRDKIKEAVIMRKVSVLSTWTLEDFKNAIAEDISSPVISDVNLKIIFEELMERVREREEKEAKRRIRIADDFYMSLVTSKDITYSSRWDDIKPLYENRLESWLTLKESFFREIFDKHIAELKKARDERKQREDKAKERDRRNEKSRRGNKDRGKRNKRRKDETDSENNGDNRVDSSNRDESRRSGRDKEKKHRKRHYDDMGLDESRDSHRHSAERKKSKQLEQHSSASAEYESRHKRYKKDHRRGDYDDQNEGEDGEVR